jgi:hypothetical protein
MPAKKKQQPRMFQLRTTFGPHDEWAAQMTWMEGHTQGGPMAMIIGPSDVENPPPGGITSTVLRDINIANAVEEMRQTADLFTGTASPDDHARLRELAAGGITDEYLAQLSWAYIAAVEHGIKKPLEHLAEVTGKTNAAIKNNLWLATRQGILLRSPGRAGGAITQKGIALLPKASG